MSAVLRAAVAAKLAPYMLAIKLGILAAIFLSGLVTGCQIKEGHKADEIRKLDHDLTVCGSDRAILSETLGEVSRRADEATLAADAQAKAADAAVKQADKARKAYDAKLSEVDRALSEAKRSPTCRAQLEQSLCIDLD